MTVRRQAFTLIEVVLALAILGAGLVGLLAAASRCLAVVRGTRDYEVAQRVLGQGDLDYPMVPSMNIRDVEVRAERYDGFTYSREVEEREGEDGLYVVRTQVLAPAGTRRTRLEVVRYFYTTNYPGFEERR